MIFAFVAKSTRIE